MDDVRIMDSLFHTHSRVQKISLNYPTFGAQKQEYLTYFLLISLVLEVQIIGEAKLTNSLTRNSPVIFAIVFEFIIPSRFIVIIIIIVIESKTPRNYCAQLTQDNKILMKHIRADHSAIIRAKNSVVRPAPRGSPRVRGRPSRRVRSARPPARGWRGTDAVLRRYALTFTFFLALR